MLLAIVGAAVDTPAAQGQLAVSVYPWTQCSYAWMQYGHGGMPARDVTVAINPLYPLPADAPIDAYHDGVENSFRNRLVEAINRWNYQIDTVTDAPYWLSYIGLGNGDIDIAYSSTGGPNAITQRTIYGSGGLPCTVNQKEPDLAIVGVSITIDVQNDWFTQPDNRRAFWEQCPGRNFEPDYTCDRFFDVGATMAHELGHALGLRDVQDLNAHYGNTAATDAARCWSYSSTQAATMCSNPRSYSSARRTLDLHDGEALFLHYWNYWDYF